jgi:hypothetical protein
MLTFDFISTSCLLLACVTVCFGLWLQRLRVQGPVNDTDRVITILDICVYQDALNS